MRHTLTAFSLCALLASTAFADMQDCTTAYTNEIYVVAYKFCLPLAEQGNALAQQRVGYMYNTGNGVAKDFAQALQWYAKAADQGNAKGQYSLGRMHYNGEGVPKNEIVGEQWFRKSADQGYAPAQFYMGVIFENGIVVERDTAQAAQWYRKAAEQNDGQAQTSLGIMYNNGKGVPKDATQAAQWFRKAADQGDALAQFNLGAMYVDGLGVVQDDVQAAQWLRKAADQGNAEAQNNLAWMYEQGKGVEKDFEQAMQWYGKAAANGNISAKSNLVTMQNRQATFNETKAAAEAGKAFSQLALGDMYENGLGVKVSNAKALQWYMKAFDQGQAGAREAMAAVLPKAKVEAEALKRAMEEAKNAPPVKMASYTMPVLPARKQVNITTIQPIAPQTAPAPAPATAAASPATDTSNLQNLTGMARLRKAAEQGDAVAQRELAIAYEKGEGVAANDEMAAKWYRKAAEQGDGYAEITMGNMYVQGKGVSMNYTTALDWYRLAEKHGDSYTRNYARDRIANIEKYIATERTREQQMANFIREGNERTARENAAAARAAAAEECGWACMNARASAEALKKMQDADNARRNREAHSACTSSRSDSWNCR
jgi:TPR repeat protein